MHRSIKAFGGAFLLTLCGGLLAGGILLADVNSRRITFGDATPPYTAVQWPSAEEAVPFLPPHWKPLCWLWEGEQWLFDHLINR
jgi:hypothetical protein